MEKKGGKLSFDVTGDAELELGDGTAGTVMIRPEGDCKVVLKVGRGCRIDTFVISERGSNVSQVNRIGEGSVVRTHAVWLDGGSGSILNSLEGPGAEAYDIEVFCGRGSAKLRLNSVLRHAGRGTKGNILIKGIVRDTASAKLDGMIKIEKSGGGAESFLSEHVMLLNPGAHATADPELEIENNDVSSRHAASVSRIDEEKIFYLESRGIAREDSRRLITEGFVGSALERIEDEGVRKMLMDVVLAAL